MKFAILLVIVVAMAGLTLGAFSSFISRRALDSARRENEQLRTRHEAIVEDALALGERATATIEHGRRMTRPAGRDRAWLQEKQRMPSADAGREAIIAWIAAKGAQLESLAVELAALAARPATKQASTRDQFTVAAPDTDSHDARGIRSARSRMAGSA